MPLLLLFLVPLVVTAALVPFLSAKIGVSRLAALVGFAVAVALASLYVASEWRSTYGLAKLAEASLAVLLAGAATASLHGLLWALVSRRRSRSRRSRAGRS